MSLLYLIYYFSFFVTVMILGRREFRTIRFFVSRIVFLLVTENVPS